MQVHRSHRSLPPAARGGVVAIGNFDGVHRGHRRLLEAARAEARRLAAPLGVLTFEPHPLRLVRPDQAPPLLTPLRLKALRLAELGVARLFALKFDDKLRQMTPAAFVRDVLVDGLAVRHVVVGYDFRFGHKAAGDVDMLRALGEQHGFAVTKIEPVTCQGEVCSSSRIRAAIAAGDVALAHQLLAHPFTISGRVIRGAARGRDLGYPTANIAPGASDLLWPPPGIYAVRAGWQAGGEAIWADAVASLGYRPTFAGENLLLEVHLLDRNLDLYGKRLCCAFIARQRAEETFASIAALQDQMAEDCRQARAILAESGDATYIQR